MDFASYVGFTGWKQTSENQIDEIALFFLEKKCALHCDEADCHMIVMWRTEVSDFFAGSADPDEFERLMMFTWEIRYLI